MNVFFDVDFTILGSDGSLRPHTEEVFQQLVSDGHAVYIWSGMGDRTDDVRQAGLESLVTGIYQKPLYDFDAFLDRYGIPVVPDFVIDDYPEIVTHFGGLFVTAYVNRQTPDDELMSVPKLVAERSPTI